jgi:hypothetical protein
MAPGEAVLEGAGSWARAYTPKHAICNNTAPATVCQRSPRRKGLLVRALNGPTYGKLAAVWMMDDEKKM